MSCKEKGCFWPTDQEEEFCAWHQVMFSEALKQEAVWAANPKIDKKLFFDLCPNCGGKVSNGATFCNPTCVLVYHAHLRRKVDPVVLAKLNKIEWLPRQKIADFFGVTKGAINSAIYRHKLSRLRPTHCHMKGCNEAVILIRNVRGYLTGTLCLKHKKIAQARYARENKQRLFPPKSKQERSAQARAASLERWSKPEWSDSKRRSEFGMMLGAARKNSKKVME
jgi:hypothetical protein